MAEKNVDFFVIGGGSGGVRAARIAGSLGASVAIAEDKYWGGTCVNVGCVPKKLFVFASEFSASFKDAAGFGWELGPSAFDWQTLLANKNEEIARLNGVYERILKGANVEVIEGRARFDGPNTVTVGDDRYSAKHILIATGGTPTVPEFPGNEHVITSDEAFFLPELPEDVIVVGGGYIAVEFAGIFQGLGVKTTQLYRGDLFLRGFDDDVREALATEMRGRGIDLRMPANIKRIDKASDGRLTATLDDGSTLSAACIMYATGRIPATADLGLERAGVACTEGGAVIVDDEFHTNVANVYAVGDVIDKVNLTPVALAQGMRLAQRLFGADPHPVGYEFIPTAVFSQPTIGTVGYTETEARARFGEVAIFRSQFRSMRMSLAGRDEKTLMKLVVDKATDRVVGLHMLGPDAGEITQGFAVALRAGATKAVFDTTIGIHPTAAEEFVTMRTPVA